MPRKNKKYMPVQKHNPVRVASSHTLLGNWLKEGLLLHQKGRLTEAIAFYERILNQQDKHTDALGLLAAAYKQLGNFQVALKYFDKYIEINRKNAAVFENRGVTLQALNRANDALESFDEAILLKPDAPSVYNFRGITLHSLKRFDEALETYDQAILLKSNFANAYFNRGRSFYALGRFEAALKNYDQVVRLKPDYVEGYINRGTVLTTLNRLDEALEDFNEVIRQKPALASVYNSRGVLLHKLSRLDEALEDFDKAILLKKEFRAAYHNRGACLKDLKRPEEALESCNEAIRLKPVAAEPHALRGLILKDLGLSEEALKSCEEALRLKPDSIEGFINRGSVLNTLKQFDEALQSYTEAMRIDPDRDFLFGMWIHSKMKTCDWSDLSPQIENLQISLKAGKRITPPFPILGLVDNPEMHLLASQIYIDQKYPASDILGPFKKRSLNNKIRIGYYSADFHNHATTYLMAELFESHDHHQFEIYGFSFGPKQDDEMRHRLMEAFDQFIDVSNRSDVEVAKISRELCVDIAVDLKGLTKNSRTGIFAMRCAPIQVNYLGYPGTTGASFIDYIVADQVVIPVENQRYFAEKVVYMPHSYQVNDAHRKISEKVFTKRELGLPESGFIFCCFNNNFKILPDTFSLWMELLLEVDGSVLWLYGSNATAIHNLRSQAQQKGIDPSRLVFAAHMSLEDHLARHRLADLFLDTLPCNAHTTASDALWAGLPLLTMPGQSFSARVAASLLTALDLPELICKSRDEYRTKAVSLAKNTVFLKQIKSKLNRNIKTTSLFNGNLFTKQLEQAYRKMHESCVNGKTTDHIYVTLERNSFSALDRNSTSMSEIDLSEMRNSCSEDSFMKSEKSLGNSAAYSKPKDAAANRLGFQVHVDRSSPFSRIFDPLAFQFVQLLSKHDISVGQQNQARLIFGAHQNISYWIKELRDTDVIVNLEHLDDPDFKKKHIKYINLLKRCSRVLTLWHSNSLDRESQIIFEPPVLTPSEIMNAKFQVNSQGLFLGSLNARRALRLREIASHLKLPLDLSFNLHGFDMWTTVATASHLLSVDFYKSAAFNKYRLALFIGLPSTCSIFITNGQTIPPEYEKLKGMSVFDDESSIDFDVTDPKWTKEVLALQKETGALMNESFFKGDFLGQLVF